MITAYKNKKDLYATVATKVYNNDYWDNMEHTEDGEPNPAGKKRRSACKSLILGIMYGRGAASIAEQINQPIQEAQKIIDSFYKGYPKVKEWIDKTQEDAKKNGYVEDLWGRRRRLPDIQRPPVEVRYKDKSHVSVPSDFNPLLGSTGLYGTSTKSDIEIFTEKALACHNRRDIEEVKKSAALKGIEVLENGGFIAQAERQCVNARVQGGAASLSKLAMLKVANDPVLKELNFRTLIMVHDEVIGECPEANADKVAERLPALMVQAAVDAGIEVPMKCDPTIEPCWYYSDYADTAKEEYSKYIENGMSEDAAFDKLLETREEITPDRLHEMLQST